MKNISIYTWPISLQGQDPVGPGRNSAYAVVSQKKYKLNTAGAV